VVFHTFATPGKVQTHLISYTLKDKLKHRCREYLERGFKRHSERSVKNIKSRHILTACFLGPWFQTFELPLYIVGNIRTKSGESKLRLGRERGSAEGRGSTLVKLIARERDVLWKRALEIIIHATLTDAHPRKPHHWAISKLAINALINRKIN
jgi:hypothetical protein